MKIDICLVSCNNNEKYYSFYPYIKQIWEKKFGIKCILIFVGNNNELPEILKPYFEDIIIYQPKNNMHTAFIAQNIRLLYPALLSCENGIIISDIDIIPISKKYFVNQIEQFSSNSFINLTYEDKCDIIKEYYICYNIANSTTWSDIFNIKTVEDIDNLLYDWYNNINYIYNDKYRSKCLGFHNDQLMLYKYINLFQEKDRIELISKKIRRFDIGVNKIIKNKDKLANDINDDLFDDFHLPKKIN